MIVSDDLGGEDHCLDSIRYLLGMVYNMNFPESERLAYFKKALAPAPLAISAKGR